MASVFVENKSWERLFLGTGTTTQGILLSVNILLCPIHFSKVISPCLATGHIHHWLECQTCSQEAAPLCRKPTHPSRASAAPTKMILPFQGWQPQLWCLPPPSMSGIILLAVQGKLLLGPNRSNIQNARALPSLDDGSSPAPGNTSFRTVAPVLERASPEVLPSLLPRSGKKGDGIGGMHIVRPVWHWQQNHSCPFLRQQPQLVAKASPVLQQQDPATKADEAS